MKCSCAGQRQLKAQHDIRHRTRESEDKREEGDDRVVCMYSRGRTRESEREQANIIS